MESGTSFRVNRKQSGILTGVNPVMAILSLVVVAGFVLFTILNSSVANEAYSTAKAWIESDLKWLYILIVCAIFFFSVWLMFSQFGKVKLGGEDQSPEFSRFAWFAMLFSAGVGIGLLFWSIAEPIYHFQGNPFLDMHNIQPGTVEASQVALRITMFHWGLHGWAIYAFTGLCLAYFSYRRGLPLTIRSALYPIFGDRIFGPIGHTVDLLAVFGTVFGVATTLGLGVVQMNSGLNYLFGLPISTTNQVLIIAAVSAISTVSTVIGVNKGMKVLSEWNIKLTVVLLGFFLLAGPTVYILGLYVTSIGDYLTHIISMGFWVDPDASRNWQGNWTIFYWGWWIAWAPFVGMFIARISRGRTIREFLVGAMVVPTSIGFLWLCIFGGTALHMEIFGSGGLVDVVNKDLTAALYQTIELLNVDWATRSVAALATLLIITWFVTSADSGTLVICTLLSMGDIHPPRRFRIFWGAGIGVVTAAILLAGGLTALQNISIIVALPFSIVLILMAWGLSVSLYKNESRAQLSTAKNV